MPFTKAFFIRSWIVELADASRRSLKKWRKKLVNKKIQKGERSSKKIVIKIFKFLCFLLMLIRNKSCWETSLTIREKQQQQQNKLFVPPSDNKRCTSGELNKLLRTYYSVLFRCTSCRDGKIGNFLGAVSDWWVSITFADFPIEREREEIVCRLTSSASRLSWSATASTSNDESRK